jgi:hypothetical protein
MQERTHAAQTRVAPTGGLDNVFGDHSIFTPMAQARHGVHRAPVPDGQTVGEIRRRMRDRLALDPDTPAYIDGNRVADDVRVRAGQLLAFMHQAGEKGCH